ncbi:MAG: hypothetical protein ABIG60_01095 [Patescibacteria group bacterium]
MFGYIEMFANIIWGWKIDLAVVCTIAICVILFWGWKIDLANVFITGIGTIILWRYFINPWLDRRLDRKIHGRWLRQLEEQLKQLKH